MRTRLRFAALSLTGALCFAVSTRAEADDKNFAYCKIGCAAATAGCIAFVGDMEFCAGVTAGCIYGCGVKGAE